MIRRVGCNAQLSVFSNFLTCYAVPGTCTVCLTRRGPPRFIIVVNMANPNESPDQGVAVAEAAPKTKVPPLFRVVLLNDDYTPMEFVVEVLEQFFAMARHAATRVMLEVHTKGKGECGLFTRHLVLGAW